MAKFRDADKVKSARRVLEVLEFFNAERRQATVMEIARQYGYPQSSTSQLLSSLTDMGFLHRDRRSRVYRPTVRVATLGAWIQPRMLRQGRLLAMMDALAEDLGATVVLAGLVGVEAQVFHAVAHRGPAPPAGAVRSLTMSAVGSSLLLVHDRQHVAKLVRRLNAEAGPDERVNVEAFMKTQEAVRSQGYALKAATDAHAGGCAVLLPQLGGEEPLALGLEFEPGDDRPADTWVRSLRGAIALHLGPMLAHTRVTDPPGRQTLEAAAV